MDEKNKNWVKRLINSFIYALDGIVILFREERNARFHLSVSVFVVVMGFLLHISTIEWLIVLILIALVLSMEAINSALENLCDHVTPKWNNVIKKVKDLSAAAVLMVTIIAIICGLIIFLPKLYLFLAALIID